MKDRIDLTIVLVSLLTTCVLVCVGCTPKFVSIAAHVDSESAVMQPTFCAYQGRYLRERLDIESIKIWKVLSSPENKNRQELNWQHGFDWQRDKGEMVWWIEYKAADTFMKSAFMNRPLRQQPPPAISCLAYRQVPLGYQQKVKPSPLEPEQLYVAEIWGLDDNAWLPERLYFIIRLDVTGIPDRLEYSRFGTGSGSFHWNSSDRHP